MTIYDRIKRGPGKKGYPPEVRLFAVSSYARGEQTSAGAIQERLILEFDFPQEPPSERQIQRWIAAWRKLPPEIRNRDLPFSWERTEMAELPWEASALVMECWKDYELADVPTRQLFPNRRQLAFTNRLARWCWRVAQSAPTLALTDTIWIAAEYALREQLHDLLGQPFEVRAWNAWLAYRPWESLNDWWGYLGAVQDEATPALPHTGALDFYKQPDSYSSPHPQRRDDVEVAARLLERLEDFTPTLSEPHWYFGDRRELYALPPTLHHTVVDWFHWRQPLKREDPYYARFLKELEADVERSKQAQSGEEDDNEQCNDE